MQQVPAYGHVAWRVVYAPGAIEARGYRGGKLVLSERRETTGKPAAIHLSCDRTTLGANAEDVAVAKVEIVDAQGRLVATTDNQVQFALRGPARLIGVGNGDPSSHEDDKAPQRKAFNGLCAALLQTTRNSGDIVLQATAAGLISATLRLRAASVKARASVG
ncbi:beta-galactosidase [Xanthomonas oryzae]|nr:beta-galactosidase [Xanthomonas oryzae pv. oryzae]KOR43701.1 beta-galactosidase [Xanthomonas oryzae]